MRKILSAILLGEVCAATGCSAVGSRVVGGRYFSGVRCNYAMCFDRNSIDPDSRIHPALALVDMPFSLVATFSFYPMMRVLAVGRHAVTVPLHRQNDDARRNKSTTQLSTGVRAVYCHAAFLLCFSHRIRLADDAPRSALPGS